MKEVPMPAPFPLRTVSIALASALFLNGCATTQGGGEPKSVGSTLKDTFNNDDPCANSKRNIGILTGALAGAAIAAAASDKNKGVAALVGALAGGGIGALIGNQLDKRECELHKIQQKYQADIEMTRIAAVAPPATSAAKKSQAVQPQKQEMGMSVNVGDQEGKPQFASGSDQVTPEALAIFQEIAKQYVPPSAEADKKAADAVKNRRVLLVGHTDDTGNSQLNADLSERRAKTVAKILAAAGVPEDRIYYQGAGETLPRADNSTPEGRAKNRRVEIIDLNDEVAFSTYLENRRPNTAFYRPSVEAQPPARQAEEGKAPVKQVNKPEPRPTAPTRVMTAKAALPANFIDFGGRPYSLQLASVDAGTLVTAKSSTKFSLIGEAQASSMERIQSCVQDRPRNTGLVKSLKDGSAYRTAEYMPGLYGRTWADMVNGNLVVLNKVAVLRDGVTPANKPELKVYRNYKSGNKNAQPDLMLDPEVNAYQTTNGVLYRIFAKGESGLQCMDILVPASAQQRAAKDGRIVYGSHFDFVSDFKPKIQN
jgi:outer membrane protein OmpA-like peptidoglycan-associated protein